MTDDEMKLFIKNQADRQSEWRNIYLAQKKCKKKNRIKEMNDRNKIRLTSLEAVKL